MSIVYHSNHCRTTTSIRKRNYRILPTIVTKPGMTSPQSIDLATAWDDVAAHPEEMMLALQARKVGWALPTT
jgi:hypothetical protein